MSEVIIGKVAVKVYPDTSAFRRDAKADLDRIERQLELNVRVQADMDGVKEHVRAGVEEIQRTIKKLTIRVDFDDQDSLRRGISQIEAQLAKLRESKINVDLDEESLKAKLAELKDDLAKIEHLDLRIDPKSEASLEASLKRINAELARKTELKVKVKTDRASLETAAREIKARLDEAKQVKLDIARGEANALHARIQQALSDMDLRIEPGVDQAKFDRTVRQIDTALERIATIEATITPEMDDLAKHRAEREIKDLKDKIDNLKAEIKPNVSEPARLGAMASLALLVRARTAEIIPKVNAAAAAKAKAALAALSGYRALSGIFGDLGRMLSNLDRTLPLIGTISLAILGLAGFALTAAANLAALSSSLASIGPLALGLPGLFGGMAVGLIATVVALKDFKKQVPEVATAWHKVEKSISTNFWDKARKPIRQMVDGLLPEFTSGFGKASTQIGGFFGNLATDLNGKLKPALKGMFGDLSDSVSIFGKHTGSIAGIITTLGNVGAHLLPRLAKWVGDLADKFDNFLTKASKDGSLQEWIDNAITAVKDLGRALANIGGIFAGISRAASAAGGSSLGMMADTLDHIHKVVDSKSFQDGMTKTFAAAFKAMHNIATEAGPATKRLFSSLADTFDKVLPTVGTTLGHMFDSVFSVLASSNVQAGVQKFFTGIDRAMDSLQGPIKSMAPMLGELLGTLGNFAKDLGPLFGAAIRLVTQALETILPVLNPIMDELTGNLAEAIRNITPTFVAMLNSLKPIMAAVTPLASAFIDLGEALTSGALSGITTLASAFSGPLTLAMKTLAGVLNTLTAALTGPLKPIANIVLAIAALKLAMIALGRTAVGGMVGGFATGWRNVASASEQGASRATAAGARLRGSYQRLGAAIQNSSNVIVSRGIAPMVRGVQGGLSRMASGARAAAGQFGAALAGFSIGAVIGQLAHDSSNGVKALSVLGSAAAGAAAGFAMGGGLGAAVGGAAGLIGGLVGAYGGASEAEKQFAQDTQNLTSAILDNNGALNANVRQVAAKALADSGALAVAAKYGISLTEVTNAALGNATAQAQLNSQMTALKGTMPFGDMAKLAGSTTSLANSTDGAVAKAKLINGALAGTAGAAKGATTALTDTRTATQRLSDTLAGLGGKAMNVAADEINFKQSVRNMTAALKDNGTAFTGNTNKALANRQALISALEAAKQHAQTMIDAGKDSKTVSTALSDNVKWLISQAKNAGVSGKALQGLIQKYGLMPGQIATALKASGSAGTKATTNVANGAKAAQPKVVQAGNQIGQATVKSITSAIQDGIPGVTSAVNAVYSAIGAAGSGWGSVLYYAGQSVMQGFIAGLDSLIGAALARLDRLTNDIPKHKGPAAKDKKLLYSAGVLVMKGFDNGLKYGTGGVLSHLDQFTKLIGKGATAQVAKDLKNGADKLRTSLKAYDQLGTKLQDAKQKLSDLLATVKQYKDTIKQGFNDTGSVAQTFDPTSLEQWTTVGATISKLIKGGIATNEDAITETLKGLGTKIASATKGGIRKSMLATYNSLTKQFAAWKSVTAKIEAQKDKLANLTEEANTFAASVGQSIRDMGNVSNVGGTSFSSIVNGLQKSVDKAKDFVTVMKQLGKAGLSKEALQQLYSAGPDALRKAQAILASGPAGIKQINSLQGQIDDLATQAGTSAKNDLYAAGLAAAQGVLDGLLSQKAAITTLMISLGNTLNEAITRNLNPNANGGGKVSFSSVVSGLKQARDRAVAFNNTMKQLEKKGLSKRALDQLYQAGPDALENARAILASGKAGIAEVNRLQAQINAAATSAANRAANDMYAAGVNTAKGLVQGLKDQRKNLLRAMRELADGLVKEIKTKLDIHSPSRVMKSIGSFVVKGLQHGMESQYGSVHRSLRRFAGDIAGTEFDGPTVSLGSRVNRAMATAGPASKPTSNRIFNYYAAAGHTLPEEDVWAASQRSRFAW